MVDPLIYSLCRVHYTGRWWKYRTSK